ncbi:helix-turn-helix domain-containing protein [Candidatus Thalassolituus haligoni]|uniref:helix-turn-helix domain-containing protein n=1 Tax=Candidatus Thalassolituus haligoni TaxID=3100113 RepID=UPI0035156100|tara:strand:+ start:1055 stop:2056 length:1002 start_codon:yes stop_codon:yes gene_type:complete
MTAFIADATAHPVEVGYTPSDESRLRAACRVLSGQQRRLLPDSVAEVRRPVRVERLGEHVQIALEQVSMACHWHVPSGVVQLLVSHAGNHQLSCSGKSYQLQAGDILVVSEGSRIQLAPDGDGFVSILMLPVAELKQAAMGMGWLWSGRHKDIPVCRSPELERLVRDMAKPQYSPGYFHEHIHYYQLRVCYALVLQLWQEPGHCFIANTPIGDRVVHQLRQRVLETILDEPEVSELAAYCQVSVRTLYNRLKATLGCTLGEFIRQLKIECVFQDLNANPRIVRNVTEVAMKYGFSNPGRFAHYYRQHIGELPSETLRRNSAAAANSQTSALRS